MIKKYVTLSTEQETLKDETESRLCTLSKEAKDLEAEMRSKISALADKTGKTLYTHFYGYSLSVAGMGFISTFDDCGIVSTTSLWELKDMPNTVEEAREKAEEMFKAKEEWKELLVKIDEVLKEQ